MLKLLLLIPIFSLTFSMADMNNPVRYENISRDENLILKLKLEIYELREKNSKLEKIIDNFDSKSREERRRADAIAQLKKDLRMSRKTRSPSLLLLH